MARMASVRLVRSIAGLGVLVLVFLASLLPRLASLGTFITPDEPTWMQRAVLFLDSLRLGDLSGTLQSGHPGVTTMLLALLGMGEERAEAMAASARTGQVYLSKGFTEALSAARVPFAVVGAVCIAGMFLLARRLLGTPAALLASLLAGLDPWLAGYAGLVHVDALLTCFMTVALLAAMDYWLASGRFESLVVSGVVSGLAFLTKVPSVVLAAAIPTLALVGAFVSSRQSRRSIWLLEVAAWGLLAAVTYVVLWPAMWVQPLATLQEVVSYTEAVGGAPHEHLNYFAGQVVLDPGPVAYLVALPLRLTPLVLVGLAALVIVSLRGKLPGQWRLPALVLSAYAAAFVAIMLFPPKKFDRYLMPVVPVLELLAAMGALSLGQMVSGKTHDAKMVGGVLLATAVLQGTSTVAASPYLTAYYSPLFGGARAAQELVLVGWGEGLDQIAAYLSRQPAPGRIVLVSHYDNVMAAQFPGRTLPPALYNPEDVDYVAVYINQVQRHLDWEVLGQYWRVARPEFVARVHGAEYAWLYRVDRGQAEVPLGVEFGETLRLVSYGVAQAEIRPGDVLRLTLLWQLLQRTPTNWQVFAHLVDSAGKLVAQRDRRLGGDVNPTSLWEPDTVRQELYLMQLPVSASPGVYTLVVGVYDLDTMARLPTTRVPSGVMAHSDRVELATVIVGR